MLSSDEEDYMTPTPSSTTKVVLEDPFVDPPHPARQNQVQLDLEPTSPAVSQRRSRRLRITASMLQPTPKTSENQDQAQPQSKVQKNEFSGHGHPVADSPFVTKLKQAAKASSENLNSDWNSARQIQPPQQAFSGHGHPLLQPNHIPSMNEVVPKANESADSYTMVPARWYSLSQRSESMRQKNFPPVPSSFQVCSQPELEPEPFQPSRCENTTTFTGSTFPTQNIPKLAHIAAFVQGSAVEPACIPTQVTHKVCNHIILHHSMACKPTGSICGFRTYIRTVRAGLCPRCATMSIRELEVLIRGKVDRVVNSARKRSAAGDVDGAIANIDTISAEVFRLRAVRDWKLHWSGVHEQIRAQVNNDVGASVRPGQVDVARTVGAVVTDVDMGQKMVDSIEGLKFMMKEWVEAGGDEGAVRERIRDVLGVDGGHFERGAESGDTSSMAQAEEARRGRN